MAPSERAEQKPGAASHASTSLIIHIELPALKQSAQLRFALDSSKSDRVFGGLYEFVSGISREWDEQLLEFDVEGTENTLENLRSNVAADLDSWNRKVKEAEEWKRRVDNAASTMNKMRDAYFKELFHLREQVYQQDKANREGVEFQPVYALHFDPGEFTMDEEVSRLVAAKSLLLEQEFRTKYDEFEVKVGARMKSLGDQLIAAKMIASRKDALLAKVKRKFGWDNQKLKDMLENQRINEEKVKKRIEERAEEAEQLAITAFQELAEKQADSEEVYAEAQVLKGFLERKYGSLKEAAAELSWRYESDQRMGLSEFQEFANHISYVTDARRAFVRLSGGKTFTSLGELMERLAMPPPPRKQAPADNPCGMVPRRKNTGDLVEVTEDKLDDNFSVARRQTIDTAIACAVLRRRKKPRYGSLGRREDGDESSSDFSSEGSDPSDFSDLASMSSSTLSLLPRKPSVPTIRKRKTTLKVSCEVMTDVTYDSGAQAAFLLRGPNEKDTKDVGCDAWSFAASFQKVCLVSRGCQSSVDGRLLDKATELFDQATEEGWTDLVACLTAEEPPDEEEAEEGAVEEAEEAAAEEAEESEEEEQSEDEEVADEEAAAEALGSASDEEEQQNDSAAGMTKVRTRRMNRKSATSTASTIDAGSLRGDARSDGAAEEKQDSGDDEEVETEDGDQERDARAGAHGEEIRVQACAGTGPRPGCRAIAAASQVSLGGPLESVSEPLEGVPEATFASTGGGQPAPEASCRERSRRRLAPAMPSLGDEDELLPPAGETTSRIKKALGQAMSRHVPGMKAMSAGVFGRKSEQTGGTGETSDPDAVRAPSCDVAVQTDTTPEQALAFLDWEPSQDLPNEEQVQFLLRLTGEIESRLPKIWSRTKRLVGQQPSSIGDQLVRRLARWPVSGRAEDGDKKETSAPRVLTSNSTVDFNDDESPSSRHTFGGALGQRRTFDGRQEPILWASVTAGDGLLGDGLPNGEATTSGLSFRSKYKRQSQPGREFVDDAVLGLSTPAAKTPQRRGTTAATSDSATSREEGQEGNQQDDPSVSMSPKKATTARRMTGADRVRVLVEEAKRRSSATSTEANDTSEVGSNQHFASEAQDDGQESDEVLSPGWSGLVPRASFSSRRAEEADGCGQSAGPRAQGTDGTDTQELLSSRSPGKPALRKLFAREFQGQVSPSAPERKSFGVGRVSFGGVMAHEGFDDVPQRQTEPVLKTASLTMKPALKSNRLKAPIDSLDGPARGIDDAEHSLALDGLQLNAAEEFGATNPRRPRGLPADAFEETSDNLRRPGAASGARSAGVRSEALDAFRRRDSAKGAAPTPLGGELLACAAEAEAEGFLPPVLPMLPAKTDRSNLASSGGHASPSSAGQFSDGLDSAGVQVRVGTAPATWRHRSQLPSGGLDGQRPATSRGATQQGPPRDLLSDVPSALRVDKQPTCKGNAQSFQGLARDQLSGAPNAMKVDRRPTSQGGAQGLLPEASGKSKAQASRPVARSRTHHEALASSSQAHETAADLERVTFSGVLPSNGGGSSRRESSPLVADGGAVTRRRSWGGPGVGFGRGSVNLGGQGGKAKK